MRTLTRKRRKPSRAGLNAQRRVDNEMFINILAFAYSDNGFHGETIGRFIKEDIGETLTVGQLHYRNHKEGRKLRDYRDGDTSSAIERRRAIIASVTDNGPAKENARESKHK